MTDHSGSDPVAADIAAAAAHGPRRLRIAVLSRNSSAAGGGAEGYSVALVEQLAQRHEIHVFAQHVAHAWPGVQYHRIAQPLRRPRWINQLWYALATWQATRSGFDLVHSHELTWHGQVQTVHVLPLRHNLFHGLRGAGLWLRRFKVWSSPRLLAYLWLESRRLRPLPSRRIVLTAPGLRPVLEACYPASSESLRVITPGVHLPGPVPDAQDRLRARQALGLPASGRGVLLVGNDYRKKGLGTMIEALAELPADVWLAVVGNPAQQAQFAAQARGAGVGSRVHFLGSLRDMAPAYRAADCLAHPTREDTFAMVVLEAMAHGLPVLVSGPRHCGIAELLSDGVDALLLPDPTDAAALAQALRRLLDDEPLRAALGQRARAFAAQRSWQRAAREQELLYFEVAGN